MINFRRLSAAAAALFMLFAFICTVAALEPGDAYVTTVYNERNGLPTGEANDVIQTSDGYIWIGSYGGLIRYDGTVFRNYSLEGLLPSSSVRSLFEDSSGRLYIGTNDMGAFFMEKGVITKVEGPAESFLCIRGFAEGSDGTVYVASNSGMGEIKDGKLTPYEGKYVSGETVYSIAVDKFGRLWGALNSGLCAVVKDGNVLEVFSSDIFFDGDEEIYCTASGRNGSVWLGSSGTSIVRVTMTSDALDVSGFETKRIKTEVSTHNSIKPQSDGSAVVCGGWGACIVFPDDSMLNIAGSDKASAVNSACVDYEGTLWLASTSFGIIKYNAGCFTSTNALSGLENVPVNAVVNQHGLWYVATDSGLFIYNGDWSRVENELTEKYDGVRIRALLPDKNGCVWVAAYSYTDPLSVYDPKNDTIRSYGMEDGLISTSTRTLLELSDGSIAVGTQEGLNLIRDGEIVSSFGVDKGLTVPSVLCITEGPDGEIFAGSDGGGIYEIKDGKVTNHGFSEGLDAGVVLRILKNSDEDGYFVSAGSALYYWENDSFRLISNIEKGAGSIFDFYDRDGKLWILQNSGILSYDKARLLDGDEVRPQQYSFQHGLSGSLNANTWNWLDADGELCISTRSGLSFFNFETLSSTLPKAIINDVNIDGTPFENPSSLDIKPEAGRITISFAALTYTGTTDVNISYRLEGFDRAETVISGAKSESVSYTNLPGGEYTFRLTVFDPDDPDNASTVILPIVKAKKLTEQPIFIALFVILVVAVTALIAALIFRAKIRSVQKRERELHAIVEQSLQTFAHTIDAKDRYTNGHSMRVAEYSRELARRMGKSEEEQQNIYYIALLHDIGKIGVPDSILNKPGKLTEDERNVIQSHPTIGGEILKDFTALDGIAEGAKYHHERYDGNGYGEKLKGNDIPEVARIIGVADTYDAMSSDRVYRKGLPSEVIIEELKKNSGTQFDPKVVPYMLDMIKDGTAPIKTDLSSLRPADGNA